MAARKVRPTAPPNDASCKSPPQGEKAALRAGAARWRGRLSFGDPAVRALPRYFTLGTWRLPKSAALLERALQLSKTPAALEKVEVAE